MSAFYPPGSTVNWSILNGMRRFTLLDWKTTRDIKPTWKLILTIVRDAMEV